MKRLLRIVLVLMPLLPSGIVHAVSLGDEFILSRLGDPVEVEIEVLQWEDLDLERVQIVAAGQREYEAFNLVWHPDIARLNFNLVGPDFDGEVRVLVTSRDPFTEPFLELLLVLRWPGGSLLREYVLLFDPPGTAVEAAETAPAGQELVEQAPERPDVRAQQAIEVETLAAAASTPAPVPASERRTYQVRPGDNLWDIARQFRPAGAGENLYQMLLSIHDLNRRSFINGNISLLRANALLELPTREDMESINPATAQAIFDQRWDEGTRRFEAAQRGEALPVFGGLAPPAPLAEEAEPVPDLPLGQEASAAGDQQNALIMVDSNNALQPLPDIAASADGARVATMPASASPLSMLPEAPPVVVVVERSDPVPASQALQAVPNAALERINDSAAAVEQLLTARQQRLEEVQLQLLALRERVEQARAMAAGLEGRTVNTGTGVQGQGNTLMLGVLTAVLTLALVGALVLVLREAGRLRRSEQMLAHNPVSGYRTGTGREMKAQASVNAGNKGVGITEDDALMAELEDLLAPENTGFRRHP